MADVCGDNRFEIIAKVKEHLIKATNIEMHPEELAQVDNILFRLWQLNYFNQCNSVICNGRENAINYRKAQIQIKELKAQNEKLMCMLASSADCETCKYYDEDLEKEDKKPCKDCFFDNSFWELKED